MSIESDIESIPPSTQRASAQGEQESQQRKRHKRVPYPSQTYYNQKIRPLKEKLEREGRWTYFLNFHKDKLSDVIAEIYHIDDHSNFDFSQSRTAMLEIMKGWKSKTLNRFKEHIANEIERSQKTEGDCGLHSCENPDILFRSFIKSFTAEKFLNVFYWLREVLDVENSSKTGLWYIKNIYANLAVEIKLYLDVKQKSDDSARAAGKWGEVILFWDEMGRREEFADIQRSHFAERRAKERTRKCRGNDSLRNEVRKRMRFSRRPSIHDELFEYDELQESL